MADQVYSHGMGGIARKYKDMGDGTFAEVIPAPRFATGGNMTVQTAASGANWAIFATQDCVQFTIVNNTGTTIEFRQDGAGVAIPVFDKSPYTIFGISSTDQIEVRRVDQSNSQVTVAARWEA